MDLAVEIGDHLTYVEGCLSFSEVSLFPILKFPMGWHLMSEHYGSVSKKRSFIMVFEPL